MSPTSFQTAPPRDIKLFLNRKSGRRWIRTTEANCSRFTVCPLWPLGNPPIMIWNSHHKPMIGLEPITCWLQISCSANWATSAYYTTQLICNQPALPTIVSLHSTIVMNWTTSAYTQHSWLVISLLCLQLSYRIQQLSWIEPHRHIFNTPENYQ